MRYLAIYLSALTSLYPTAQAESNAFKHGLAQLRDLVAYPKYEVQFLNDLPLSLSDADRAKRSGVEREDEWLGLRLEGRGRLGDGSEHEDRLELVPMRLTPPDSAVPAEYLCLMPSLNSTTAQTAISETTAAQEELDPIQSWSALSHLDGKCLYSQQGWFTYSYCHNSHIRQFRAARHRHPHPPGGYEPEEDTTFEAYTLGQAQPSQRLRLDPPSFGLSAASRYLVQKWSDGTPCDKTGRPRQVEVQIHCSMTTTDVIYLVKEMAICSYVVIIHSPHLCGLPGFRAPQVDVDPAGIRCRQVVPDEDFEAWVGSGGRSDTLRLPWARQSAAGPLGAFSEEEVIGVFEKALSELPEGQAEVGAETEEIILLSLIDEGESKLGKEQTDEVVNAVKHYLEQVHKGEEEEKEKGKPRDEL